LNQDIRLKENFKYIKEFSNLIEEFDVEMYMKSKQGINIALNEHLPLIVSNIQSGWSTQRK
jgi:hypothetical protein